MARKVGIAYYLFVFVNMTIFYLFPGGQVRVLGLMQRSTSFWMRNQPWPGDQLMLFNWKPFLILGACSALVGVSVPLYFLITRGQAFEAAAAARHRSIEQSLPTGPSTAQ